MAPPLIVEEELKKTAKTVPFLKGDERRSSSEASEGDEKTIKTTTTVPFLKGDERRSTSKASEGDEKQALERKNYNRGG